MLDDECIHGIFPSSSCTICTKKPARTSDNPHPRHSTMQAKFDGQCPGCNLPIREDVDTIAKFRGAWHHRKCAVTAWNGEFGPA